MGVLMKHDTPTSDNKLAISKQSRTPTFGSKQRRVSDSYRAFSQDIPSDVSVEVGGMTFRLHKFPLVSRSGWIRKLVADSTESDVSRLCLPDIPGGAEAFELAAKFCYGKSFEMNADNVAMLRCAAEYLAMSEKYGAGNLIERTEVYINSTVTSSLATCVKVLHTCESLLPLAEELQIVARCVNAAAEKASKEQLAVSFSQSELSACSSGRLDSIDSPGTGSTPMKRSIESWAEELSLLRIDFFQRVLGAMRERGLRYDALAGAIVHYAQRSLKGLTKRQASRELLPRSNVRVHDAAIALEHEQRVLLETIVCLLPHEKNTASITFLFGILRAAIHLDTTIACRLDLERRIGMQLEQASLDDLLIPNHSYNGDTLFDVDAVRRIVMNFLQQVEADDLYDTLFIYDPHSACSPPQSAIMKVARLLDCYLAEIAPDANLSPNKFIGIAKLMPEHARVVDDGLYRAIDIFLKAHPGVSEVERKNICARMDCGKLTQEACKHAAQNERLPVQVVVQVLYFEQMRLKSAMGGSTEVDVAPQKLGGAIAKPDYAAVCKENRELKMEMARMRVHLGHDSDKPLDDSDDQLAADKAHAPSTSSSNNKSSKLLSSFSKTLSKLNPFSRSSSDTAKTSHPKSSRPRRHSIS